jgi:anti-anti-sigma factor
VNVCWPYLTARYSPQGASMSISGGATAPYLRISTETVPEAIVLHVAGEVDLANVTMLSNAIAEAYWTNERVIVDLSRLDYLDGAGVHILERFAQRHRRRFVVVGSEPGVRRVLEVLGVIEALPVKDSLEAAREYLRLL